MANRDQLRLKNGGYQQYMQACVLHSRHNSYFPNVTVHNSSEIYIKEQLYVYDQFDTSQILTIFRKLFPKEYSTFKDSLKIYNRTLLWQELCYQINQFEVKIRDSQKLNTPDLQFNEAISVISSLIKQHKYFINNIDIQSVRVRVTSTGLKLVLIDPIISTLEA